MDGCEKNTNKFVFPGFKKYGDFFEKALNSVPLYGRMLKIKLTASTDQGCDINDLPEP